MKINYFVLLLVVSILTSSCATVLRSPKSHKVVTKITVTSNPPEANVYNKKGLVGSTPLTYNHKGRKTDVIYIKKEGYLDENAQIKRKINPVWTGVSLVTSIFPVPIAPLAVDHFTGHLYDIKTDSIHVDMVSKFGEKTSSNSDQSQVIKDEQKEQLNNTIVAEKAKEVISFPALEVLTGSCRIKVLPYTRARFELTNGTVFGALITEVHDDYFIIKQSKEKLYYTSIEKVRFFPTRLWFPIVTSVSVVPPIFWYFSGKVAERNSKKCKWDLKDLRIVEGLPEFKFGKAKCK